MNSQFRSSQRKITIIEYYEEKSEEFMRLLGERDNIKLDYTHKTKAAKTWGKGSEFNIFYKMDLISCTQSLEKGANFEIRRLILRT